MNVSEMIGYHGAVNSAKLEASLQRYETVADYAKLYDVRVDIDGIEPLIHVHHGIVLLTKKVRVIGSLCFGFQRHGG